MLPLIEVCEQNLHKGSRVILENSWLQQHAEILISPCLNQCRFCQKNFFVMLEGEVIFADNPEKLLDKVVDAVKKIEQEFDFL